MTLYRHASVIKWYQADARLRAAAEIRHDTCSTEWEILNQMFIGSLLVLAGMMGQTPLPPASNFILWGWWGPPPTEIELRTYKGAGLNTITIPDDSRYTESIRLANTEGLRVFLAPPSLDRFNPQQAAVVAGQYPNVQGWVLKEQAGATDVERLAGYVKQLRELDRVRWPLVSVATGGGEWVNTLTGLLRAGNPAILYHQQSFLESGQDDESGFFQRVEAGRRIASQTGLPFLGMVQVSSSGDYRACSESDIRYQAYSYLAAGARGLCYHTYWGFPIGNPNLTVDDSMIDRKSLATNYSYEIVTRLNEEMVSLAPHLLTLDQRALYFVGDAPAGTRPLPFTGTPFKALDAERALVGLFTNEANETWALVVNRRHGMKRSSKTQKSTFRITVQDNVKAVWEIDRGNGNAKEMPLDTRSFYVTIPGGTGCLFRFELEGSAEPSQAARR